MEECQVICVIPYLNSVSELLHGDVFGDFLEMGNHLLENSYNDAAAVVIGSTLEAHLRQVRQKFGVEIEIPESKGNFRTKKEDRMNSDLAGPEKESRSWKVRGVHLGSSGITCSIGS